MPHAARDRAADRRTGLARRTLRHDRLRRGEAMILAATLLWAVEVVYVKRLLASIPPRRSPPHGWDSGRCCCSAGSPSPAAGQLTGLDAEQWRWVLLTGLLLTAYVATWYAALARAQAVDVTAVLVFGAVITAAPLRGGDGDDGQRGRHRARRRGRDSSPDCAFGGRPWSPAAYDRGRRGRSSSRATRTRRTRSASAEQTCRETLLEYGDAGESDGGLAELARTFEGAWPYLTLIAGANRIADPLDPRVVEAYWVGNELLDPVRPADLARHVDDRFRGRDSAARSEHVVDAVRRRRRAASLLPRLRRLPVARPAAHRGRRRAAPDPRPVPDDGRRRRDGRRRLADGVRAAAALARADRSLSARLCRGASAGGTAGSRSSPGRAPAIVSRCTGTSSATFSRLRRRIASSR